MPHLGVLRARRVDRAVGPRARRQDKSGATRNCDRGVNRRQLMGQPMTDFMKACQANEGNPENLGKICNNAG